MSAPDVVALGWVEVHTALLLQELDRLGDLELDRPSALPAWSRRHLLAHVGFNAEALRRLLHWARSGEVTPMYASKEQRADEIAEGASWESPRLRKFVRDTASGLSSDIAGLDDRQWTSEVVTAQGRTVRAHEVVWMRAREVCLHTVDLGTGVDVEDLPTEFCRRLVADICALRSTRRNGRALHLLDRDGQPVGSVAGAGEAVTVVGDVHNLAGWLAGRGSGSLEPRHGQALPILAAWI